MKFLPKTMSRIREIRKLQKEIYKLYDLRYRKRSEQKFCNSHERIEELEYVINGIDVMIEKKINNIETLKAVI